MKRQFGRTVYTVAVLLIAVLFAAGCGESSDRVDAATDTAGAASSDASDAVETASDSVDASTVISDSDGSGDAASDDAMSDDAMADEAMSDSDMSEAVVAAEDASEEASDSVVEDPPSVIEPEPEDRVPQPQPSAGLLTAAEVDDNLNFAFFQGYLDRTAENYGQELPRPDLRDRITVQVVDTNGRNIANTPVQFFDAADNPPYIVHTDSAGVARFFPRTADPSWASFNVAVAGTTTSISKEDAAQGTVTITADGDDSGVTPRALDVALVLDVTGSMSDELRYLTVEFESIIERLRGTYPNADLRFGLVSYRDEGDAFVTQVFDFTSSVAEMQDYLASQRADGGGDYPEAMDAALKDANQLSWRDGNVARVMILNADAPPHTEDLHTTLDEAVVSAEKGIRIYPLAASGVGDTAEYIMRLMAVTTGGRHLFLTSDSGIGGEKQEPKTQCYQVTALDSLLLRVLESELAGERIDPHPSEIIREVGNYDRGVCTE